MNVLEIFGSVMTSHSSGMLDVHGVLELTQNSTSLRFRWGRGGPELQFT